MKWSWKIFFIQLITLLVTALAVSFVVSKIIDAQRGAGASDSTLISMAIGGFLTPILFSIICGWRRWNLKMLLVITFIVSGLYSGNPVFGILAIAIASVIYYVSGKLRDLILYHTMPEVGSGSDSPAKRE